MCVLTMLELLMFGCMNCGLGSGCCLVVKILAGLMMLFRYVNYGLGSGCCLVVQILVGFSSVPFCVNVFGLWKYLGCADRRRISNVC